MKRLAAMVAGAAAVAAFAQAPGAPSGEPSTPQERRDREVARETDRARARDAAERAGRGPRTFTVTWNAPDPLRGLFEKYLPPPQPEAGERRTGFARPWIRDVRRRVPEIAAAEGYFSTTVEVDREEGNREHLVVKVELGPRTTVGEVKIEFTGDLAGPGEEREARRQELTRGWTLAAGAPLRSADWDVAKTRLLEALAARDYAAARLVASEARVEAESAKATLHLVLDSGPAFTLGTYEVQGLARYPEAVVRRLVDLNAGERYSSDRLLELQRAIQNGPWFSSVVVDIDRDPKRSTEVPVRISVTERPRIDIGLSLGYGTDDGVRGEAAFRYRDLFQRGFDLQSSLRAGQYRQIGFADVYLPPGRGPLPGFGEMPYRDSVGVLAEHSTIEKLALSRFAMAGYRHYKLDRWEMRVGLSYQVERSYPEGGDPRVTRALAPIVAWTWRTVDDPFDPKRGGVLNVQVAAAKQSLASEQDFVRVYGQYQHWFPITARDQLLVRTEWGTTLASSRDGIPEDFLFRAGGARSNRGYGYQSLGVREGNAVVGGRYLATGSVEGIHWLDDTWGAAAFLDVGDAADGRTGWNANPSVGVGARYRTPAGPFALDLAYAEKTRKFRLSFSVTVAF